MILAFFVMAALTGCRNTVSLEGSRVECIQDCHREACHILRNAFPQDPGRPAEQPVGVAPTDLAHLLGNEVSSGRATWTAHVDAEISRRTPQGSGGVSPPVLLVGKSAHVYWLHGVFVHEGDKYYAVRHGVNGVTLLSQPEFDSLGIQTLWARSPRCPPSMVLDVGKSQVTITPYLCDLGLLAPFQRGHSSVVISNVGDAPIELGDIETSCGCTAATPAGDEKRLAPGQKTILNVSLAARNAPSVRERVLLSFRDPSSSEEFPCTLNVLAYQFPISELSERELRFGPVRQGESATCEFTLSEARTDRLQVRLLDPGPHAMMFTIRTERLRSGLNRYRVRCEWDSASLHPGAHGGKIVIRTTSKWMPEIELPTAVTVRPDVRIVPSRLSFGTVHTMDQKHLRATIVVPPETPVQTIEALNVRSEMSVTPGKPENGTVPVDVLWQPRRPGKFSHVLLFSIRTPGGIVNAQLSCTIDVEGPGASLARRATRQ